MKTITYQSKNYTPKLVTGLYIRCEGQAPNYRFKVSETITPTSGQFKGKAGYGPTLREYITDGSEIPIDVRLAAIETKQTVLWRNFDE